MLLLVFRGIFLIGILSWYSSNVWKMIDGYFKERFDKYLQREYEKNPKMREHVEANKESSEDSGDDKFHEDIVETKTTMSPIHYRQGSCKSHGDLDEKVCPVGESSMEKMAGDDRTGSGSLLSTGGDTIDDTARPSESEVIAKGASEKNAFAKSSTAASPSSVFEKVFIDDVGFAGFTKDESIKSSLTAIEITSITDDPEENLTPKMATIAADSSEVTTNKPDDQAIIDSSKSVAKKTMRRKSKLKKRQPVQTYAMEKEETSGKRKKLRFKTIIFTEEDFREAKIRGGWQDYDFTEFDDDDENYTNEPTEGILVSQLPFKPRADIGKLERVSDDEFCPLTLEDEANCDEITTWP